MNKESYLIDTSDMFTPEAFRKTTGWDISGGDSDSTDGLNEDTDTDSLVSSIDTDSESEDTDSIKKAFARNKEIEKKMLEDKTFPSPSDENFQYKLYKKRDFSLHSYPHREIKKNYQEVKAYRDNICAPASFKLNEHQSLLSNYINPNTPYPGVLVFHGTGSGKTCAAVAIAEKFKPMVEKYGTKIHILVPGPLLKQNFLDEIIHCTAETYLKIFQDKNSVVSDEDKNRIKKYAINAVNQYYRIMTYRSFYKKVLGEKIREKVVVKGNVVKSSARKTEEGEYERETSIDRIHNLDNTILIMDEAHAATAKEYGNAIKKIIDNSKQLKIVELTATPMKNLADDIVELLNYLRPKDSPIERDKIFTAERGSTMQFRPGGKEYLRKMCRGYVSYLRGADPLTYAERVDIGEIPPHLEFTKVIRCYMNPFQLKTYESLRNESLDSLERRSEAVANFVFPIISKENSKELEGISGIDGINQIKNQVKSMGPTLCKKIADTILKDEKIEDTSSLLYLTDGSKTLTGDIFSEKYLKYFSTKFHQALTDINQMVYGKKGSGLAFVYSNLVRCGIELFREVMLRNGFLEFTENYSSYVIENHTRCYFCEHPYHAHTTAKDLTTSDGSPIPRHKFHPATFVMVTGGSEDNKNEQVSEETSRMLKKVFNSMNNKEGKYLKFVLGSKVMNEGYTLRNIKQIHILDVHFNLARVDQAIGRGIRWCVHYGIMNEENPFPKVEVYKYAISLHNGISSEEELYMKAEQKYKLIKEVERILQEEAIDCPLNYSGNIFPEELEKYGDCGTKEKPCPAICGYMSCKFKCSDKLLNAKYYDPTRGIYKKVEKSDLDYSTYDTSLADEEITYAKDKIKEMYKFNHVYVLSEIMDYVKKSIPSTKTELFDDFYVYQALNDLLPVSNNDFNNFKDTIVDKFNRPGYLIYRKKYYIFSPFDQNETLPMYYRRNYVKNVYNKIGLENFIKHVSNDVDDIDMPDDGEKKKIIERKEYHFDQVRDYYDNRPENNWVGIIVQKKNPKSITDLDGFNVRKSMPKNMNKKRESGVPTWLGADCAVAKDKNTLMEISQSLKVKANHSDQRERICELVRDRLIDLEKYGTSADKNKVTYLIVPSNHPSLPFPLNLEDRCKHVINTIKKETRSSPVIEINSTAIKNGKYSDIKYVQYTIIFGDEMDKFKDVLIANGGAKKGNKWIIQII